MKRLYSKTRLVRSVSLFLLVALCIVQLLSKTFSLEVLCADMLAASSLLLLFPLSFEDPGKSLPHVLGLTAIYLILALSPFFRTRECMLFTSVAFLGVLCYTIFRAVERYGNIRTLFRTDAVWCATENFSRMFYVFLFGILGAAALTASRYEAPSWLFGLLVMMLAAFFGVNYYKAYTGRTMLIGAGKEKEMKRIIEGNLRGTPEYGGPDEHMNAIYGKVLRFMESKKPFLDENFCLDDLAKAVFTNKVYLSKAINYYSGRNFRQFVNYYRIMYATGIMKKDRRLKVTELAMMCGFRSLVTFNMAFKLYMNMTPGAYYGVLAANEKAVSKQGAKFGLPEPALV